MIHKTQFKKKLLNYVIPVPKPINKTLTPISPQPTLPSELTPQSTDVAPHPSPASRVVSNTALFPRVSVWTQPSPPKISLSDIIKPVSSAQRQTSYKLLSSTKQSRIPYSLYTHSSNCHTCYTALAQLFIQEYDRHIFHLYHPFIKSK